MTDRFLQKHNVQALERCIDQTGRVLETHLDLFNANMTIAIHVVTGITTALTLTNLM